MYRARFILNSGEHEVLRFIQFIYLFVQLNVNSIRSKFESVQEIIQNTFDIFLVCETKIDSSFPNQQFCIPEYCIF